jgi:hypothetical protein
MPRIYWSTEKLRSVSAGHWDAYRKEGCKETTFDKTLKSHVGAVRRILLESFESDEEKNKMDWEVNSSSVSEQSQESFKEISLLSWG